MNNEAHRKYHHAKSRLTDALDGLEDMKRGKASERRLLRYWREFLSNCVACQKSLQKCFSLANQPLLAQKIWEDCKNVPEIHYMYQARNSETHSEIAADGMITSVRVSNESGEVNLGFPDGASIYFHGNIMVDESGNARPLPNLFGSVRDGSFDGISQGEGRVAVRGPYIKMLDASNGGQTYLVPSSSAIEPETAYINFAQLYCEFLSSWDSIAREKIGIHRR